MNRTPEDSAWHLDRKVPIALIVAILIQTGGAIWWASSQSERVNALERQATSQSATTVPQAERIARMEAKIESVQEGISEIKRLIRREPAP